MGSAGRAEMRWLEAQGGTGPVWTSVRGTSRAVCRRASSDPGGPGQQFSPCRRSPIRCGRGEVQEACAAVRARESLGEFCEAQATRLRTVGIQIAERLVK